MGDKLAGRLVSGDEICGHEVNDSVRVRLLFVLEIETIVHLLDIQSLLVRIMFQNELLEEHKCTLVHNALS